MPLRFALLSACALIAAGCAAFDPNNVLGRQLPSNPAAHSPVPIASAALGPEGRLAAYDFVWQTVNDRYYDANLNGVDWKAAGERWKPRAMAAPTDEAFWEQLDRMTGELRDAHTRVASPQRAELISRNESVTLGFGFLRLEGRLVVTHVNPDSDAWWAGVRPGMTLREIDGRPADEAYAALLAEARDSSSAHAKHTAAARKLLSGEPGSRVALTLSRGDGSRFTAPLKRAKLASPPRVFHRVLPSGHGYVRLTNWPQSLQGEAIAALEAVKATPGIVIDLRGNPGGSALMVRNVAAQLFPAKEKVAIGRTLTRTGKPITLGFGMVELIKIEQEMEGTGTYLGPVVVLLNEDSGSASEFFGAVLQTLRRATIVGRTSCGCLLGYMGYADVPGGGKLAYSELGFRLTDGRRIEGVGVVPDKPVALTVDDLLANRDRTLEEAQALLATMGPWKAPARAAAGAAS